MSFDRQQVSSWCKCRPFRRRPGTIFGVVCSTLIISTLLMKNKFFLNDASSCISTCVRYLSYERLQRNEASKKVKHPIIRRFDVNFLGSNSPIEDRFVAGFSQGLEVSLFSVIDGHKGFRCAHFIQNHLLQYVTTALFSLEHEGKKSDVETCLTMNHTVPTTEPYLDWMSDSTHSSIPSTMVEECLTASFKSLDNYISSQALNDAKLILQGHSLTPDMKDRVLRAIEGACVTLAMVQTDTISVATTGDCRVVVGQEQAGDSWLALPLSVDQNAMNTLEVQRVKLAHPGEDSVIIDGRILGSLMPFRTFGDVDFKWEGKYLRSFVPVWPGYKTPPYITAEPVVTHHKREDEDRFMIIASDGLWERISNQEVVDIVAKTLKQEADQQRSASLMNFFGNRASGECCQPNAATELLWHALGGTEDAVSRLLNVSPSYSRMVRDDITIIVVFFK